MDQDQLYLTILLISLVIFLTLISIIQNTFNLISSMRLQNQSSAGDKKAQTILKLLDNQNRIFLTIKIIKTLLIIGVVIGLHQFNNIWITIGISILVVMITEVLALPLSRINPDKTITTLSWPIKWLLILFSPVYLLFDLLLKLLSIFFKPELENIITEQELLNIIDEAQSEGGLQESEGDLIRRSIEFNDLLAEEILTPRVDLVALDLKWNKERIINTLDENEFSRYPVYNETIDTIVGVVHSKDFKKLDERFDLTDIVKPVIFVPESYKISKLLKQIQQSKSHLVVVIDEHGGTAGIVTLEDIVEELVGEIWDEHDEEEREITQVNDHQFIVLASVELYKFEEAIDIDLQSDDSDASTVGGWIIELTGNIPTISQEFTYNNLHMTILDADEKKIIKVLVDILEGAQNDQISN
ncbi:MAG TPA: HlyC/CorC family transporter [Erysipelothrix sp.]|nr:HlyC/CorC family transporter [Erysipelothrix sp.]